MWRTAMRPIIVSVAALAVSLVSMAQESKSINESIATYLRTDRVGVNCQEAAIEAAWGECDNPGLIAGEILKEANKYNSVSDRRSIIQMATALAAREKNKQSGLLESQGLARELARMMYEDPDDGIRNQAAFILLNAFARATVAFISEQLETYALAHSKTISVDQLTTSGLSTSLTLSEVEQIVKTRGWNGDSLVIDAIRARHGDKNAENRILDALQSCPDKKRQISCGDVMRYAIYVGTESIAKAMSTRLNSKDEWLDPGSESWSKSTKGSLCAIAIRAIYRERSDFPYEQTIACDDAAIEKIKKWCASNLPQ